MKTFNTHWRLQGLKAKAVIWVHVNNSTQNDFKVYIKWGDIVGLEKSGGFHSGGGGTLLKCIHLHINTSFNTVALPPLYILSKIVRWVCFVPV